MRTGAVDAVGETAVWCEDDGCAIWQLLLVGMGATRSDILDNGANCQLTFGEYLSARPTHRDIRGHSDQGCGGDSCGSDDPTAHQSPSPHCILGDPALNDPKMFATAAGQREAFTPVVFGDAILYRFPRVFRLYGMRPDPPADHPPHLLVRVDVA